MFIVILCFNTSLVWELVVLHTRFSMFGKFWSIFGVGVEVETKNNTYSFIGVKLISTKSNSLANMSVTLTGSI